MPSRPLSLALRALPLVCAVALPAGAQQVSYTRAEQLLDWNTSVLLSGDSVRPLWYLDGNRFW